MSLRTADLIARIEVVGYRVVRWTLFRPDADAPYAVEMWACPTPGQREGDALVAKVIGPCDESDAHRCAQELARLVGLDVTPAASLAATPSS